MASVMVAEEKRLSWTSLERPLQALDEVYDSLHATTRVYVFGESKACTKGKENFARLQIKWLDMIQSVCTSTQLQTTLQLLQ